MMPERWKKAMTYNGYILVDEFSFNKFSISTK